MSISVSISTNYVAPRAIGASVNSTDANSQQNAPAQGTAADVATASSNALRGLLADPRIACQLNPGAAGCDAPKKAPAPAPSAPATPGAPGSSRAGSLDSAVRVLRDNFSVFDAAGKQNGQDGIIGTVDLEAVRDNLTYDSSLRDTAAYLLENPEALMALDMAGGGDFPDGKIAMGDLNSYGDGSEKALRTLQDHFDLFDTAMHGGSGDGKVAPGDVQAVLDNPNFFEGRNLTPEQVKEVRNAATYLSQHPGVMRGSDISRDSLNNALSPPTPTHSK